MANNSEIAFFDGVKDFFSTNQHGGYIIPAFGRQVRMVPFNCETTLVLLCIFITLLGKFPLFC